MRPLSVRVDVADALVDVQPEQIRVDQRDQVVEPACLEIGDQLGSQSLELDEFVGAAGVDGRQLDESVICPPLLDESTRHEDERVVGRSGGDHP